jgi:hypothetical protein
MADEPFALSTVAPRSDDESDYEAICAAVMDSARGRWFLEEYARRNRQADTALVLTAINRLEHLIQLERAGQGSLAFRTVLLEMARTISEARGQTVALDPPEGPARRSNERSSSRAEIFATAERIHDVAWTMRERGIDPATCQEIETLASSILTASSLQGAPQPDDAGIDKLRDVLQYLEQRIQTMLDACPPTPAPAPGANAQEETDDEARPTGTDMVSAAETVLIECAVAADQQTPDPAVEKPEMPGGAVEIASSVGTRSGAETEHIAVSLTDVPPNLEEHAEHAVTQSMAELELEPLLPEAAHVKEEGSAQPVLDVPPLIVEPLSQSPGTFEPAELSFSHGLSPLTQMSPPSPPATEMGPGQIELAPLPLIERALPYPPPHAGEEGEAAGMPDGGQEGNHFPGDLELEAPTVELPSSTLDALVMAVDESTNTCAEEKAAVELSSVRSEQAVSVLEQVSSNTAGLDSQREHASFDVAAAQKEVGESTPSPHGENENTPANTSLAPGEELQTRQNELVSAAPVLGARDESTAQTCPEDAHGSLEHSGMELGLIETAPQAPSVSESFDASNLVCSGKEKSGDAVEAVADISPAVSTPEIEIGPRELPPPETVELSKQAEDREERFQSADDTEVGPQQSTAQIGALTAQLEKIPQAIPSDRPGASALEEDVPIRTEESELVETLAAAPILLIEAHTECLPDEIVPSEPASNDVLAQAFPAAWVESMMPVSEETPESIEVVEIVAETTLQSNTSPIVATGPISTQDEDAHNVIPVNEPAVTTAAASISENEVLVVLAPDENTPAPAEALSLEETDLPVPVSEQTVDLPAVMTIASVSEHKEEGGAEVVDLPTPPPQVASTDIAHDDVLSGAWEEAVLHPEAQSAHQARLAGTKPLEVKGNEDLYATEPGTELPLVAPEVVGTAATSTDTSFDPIQEIEQELFAPSSMESAKVPAHEPPRARPIEELLPQPTLTEMSPAPSIAAAPMETLPEPPPVIAPAPQRPSIDRARPIVKSMPRPAPADPLAALRAMTDEERIALFS